jgi:hypothetical protein
VGLGAVLAALMLFSLAAGPSQSALTQIRIVSDTWDVDFPSHVAFNLTAEAPRDIVEIRLRYRLAGGGVWSYAYPAFTPGQDIAAHYYLKTARANYVPPGTEIEYYYQLRDSQGHQTETAAKVLEYEDTRFRWEQTRIGPLLLKHHGTSRYRVDRTAGEVEAGLERVQTLLGLEGAQPIKGTIYNRRADSLGAFPHQSETITKQHVFAGFAFPEKGVFLGLGLDPGLIVHESAHLLLHQSLGDPANSLPDWLDEGFASYAEPGSRPYSGRSLSSGGEPLKAMGSSAGKPADIGFFYLKAESVVAYLVEEHGEEQFRRFLGELRRGRTVDGALTATYGFDTGGLESKWRNWDGGFEGAPPGSPTRASPLVYLDVWLFGGLFLVVMLVVTVRYFIRRLRADDNPEDRLQPWEDPDLVDRT